MVATRAELERVLSRFVGDILARSMVTLSVNLSHVDLDRPLPGDDKRVMSALLKGIKVYVDDAANRRTCIQEIEFLLFSAVHRNDGHDDADERPPSDEPPTHRPVTIEIKDEDDVVRARTTGRDLCRTMGFSSSAQVKLATAISELARNIVQYAGEGQIKILRLNGSRSGVEIEAFDHGPGINDKDLVMSTSYRSRTGMGIGLKGARRLSDEFSIDTAPGSGTRVVLRKYLD